MYDKGYIVANLLQFTLSTSTLTLIRSTLQFSRHTSNNNYFSPFLLLLPFPFPFPVLLPFSSSSSSVSTSLSTSIASTPRLALSSDCRSRRESVISRLTLLEVVVAVVVVVIRVGFERTPRYVCRSETSPGGVRGGIAMVVTKGGGTRMGIKG